MYLTATYLLFIKFITFGFKTNVYLWQMGKNQIPFADRFYEGA